jgi:hypothetical protein
MDGGERVGKRIKAAPMIENIDIVGNLPIYMTRYCSKYFPVNAKKDEGGRI